MWRHRHDEPTPSPETHSEDTAGCELRAVGWHEAPGHSPDTLLRHRPGFLPGGMLVGQDETAGCHTAHPACRPAQSEDIGTL